MINIGKIENSYGGLLVKEQSGKYYWIIEGVFSELDNIEEWEEISKALYDELIRHNGKK